MKKSVIYSLLAAFMMAGCASVNSVSLTPIPTDRSRVVRAEVSRFIILAFNFDNNYIDPLVEELKQKCPNGVVSGILTKDETISYVLAFNRRVVATGYCTKSGPSVADESNVSPRVAKGSR